jgi:NIMA-interacting peptidyl-prolyl cis-trans isomerase 1
MSDEVRASHLLVKHQGSRRPASWRDPDGQYIPKKTKEAARDELLAYREQIASGVVTFADLAAKVSDCSSAKHGGDLGFFGPGKMQKAFEVRRDASAAWRPPRPTRAFLPRLFKRSSFSRQVGTSLFFVFRASLSVSFGSANADRSERSPFPLNSPRSRRAQDGTYALEVGQMSDVVDSDSGLHIILRTA